MKRAALFALLLAACSPPPEQQTDYNYLVNTVNDLDHETPANHMMLKYACQDYEQQAANYRKIRAWRISAKVDRYVEGCKKLLARDPTPPPMP